MTIDMLGIPREDAELIEILKKFVFDSSMAVYKSDLSWAEKSRITRGLYRILDEIDLGHYREVSNFLIQTVSAPGPSSTLGKPWWAYLPYGTEIHDAMAKCKGDVYCNVAVGVGAVLVLGWWNRHRDKSERKTHGG